MIELSILMSVYKEPVEYVRKAINSILNQTLRNFEFVIVLDDPQNRELDHLLTQFSEEDSRIRVIRHQKNVGLAQSLNDAFAISTGRFVARMDADDVSHLNRLETELEFLTTNSLDLVASLVNVIDEHDVIISRTKPIIGGTEAISALLPYQNVFVHPTALMKRTTFEKAGGYRTITTCQDYDLWLRLLSSRTKMGLVNEELLDFRKHKSSISARKHLDQLITEAYIRKLYDERLQNNGKDSFSVDEYNKYKKLQEPVGSEKAKRENMRIQEFSDSIWKFRHGSVAAGFKDLISSFRSKWVRREFVLKIRVSFIRRKFSNSLT